MGKSLYITIYSDSKADLNWIGDAKAKAILIFSDCLGFVKKLSRKRVNIWLSDENRIETDGSIKSIWVNKDYGDAHNFEPKKKIEIMLSIIRESLIEIGKIENWDISLFETAYEKAIATDGHFVRYSKFLTDKTKSTKCRSKITLETNYRAQIVIEMYAKNDPAIKQIKLFDTFVHNIDWDRTFDNPKWLDESKFGYSLFSGQLNIYIDKKGLEPVILIEEKTVSREELEGALRSLSFRELQTKKELVDWVSA